MNLRKLKIGRIGENKTVAFAVEEIVKYLKMLDDELAVEVLNASAVDKTIKNVVWVGLDLSFEKHLPKVKDPLVDDAICIKINDGNGFVTGSNNRSVLIAAYRFLKELGCNWVRPGAEGERIFKRRIDNINIDVREEPSYRIRCVCIEGADSYENIYDMIDFLPKVGLNGYYMQFFVPEIFFKRWYLHTENPNYDVEDIGDNEIQLFTNQLEYEVNKRDICYHKYGHGWTCEPFNITVDGWNVSDDSVLSQDTKNCLAMLNKERGKFYLGVPLFTQLCYSNAYVRNKMTDAVVEACRENPNLGVLHFYLADGFNNHCECDECIKKTPSDWYVIILNEIDEKLTKAGFNTKVCFGTYQDTLWSPEMEKINNPDRFILMFAPYNRIYGDSYLNMDVMATTNDLPKYIRNRLIMPNKLEDTVAYLKQWQKNFSGSCVDFDYHLMWAHLNDPGYEKSAKNLSEDVKGLRRLGFDGLINCQIQRVFFPSALPFNTMAATLWNDNADFEAIADEYYLLAFGEGWELVRDFLKSVSDTMNLYNNPGYMNLNDFKLPYCLDYLKIANLSNNFLNVVNDFIKTAKEVYVKEWKNMAVYCKYLLLLVEMQHYKECGENDAARIKYNEMKELLNINESEIQKVFDCWNVLDHWGRFV